MGYIPIVYVYLFVLVQLQPKLHMTKIARPVRYISSMFHNIYKSKIDKLIF
jgi:hypothetical protein